MCCGCMTVWNTHVQFAMTRIAYCPRVWVVNNQQYAPVGLGRGIHSDMTSGSCLLI